MSGIESPTQLPPRRLKKTEAREALSEELRPIFDKLCEETLYWSQYYYGTSFISYSTVRHYMRLAKFRAENGKLADLTMHDAMAALAPPEPNPISRLTRELKAIDPRIELQPAGLKLPDDISFEDWREAGEVLQRHIGLSLLTIADARRGRRP